MSAEENKALVRRVIEEAWLGGNAANVEALVSPDYLNHAALPGHQRGIEGFRHVGEWLKTAFPDAGFEIEGMICEGEMVAVRGVASGTHEGEFMGSPPTERASWRRTCTGSASRTESYSNTGPSETT